MENLYTVLRNPTAENIHLHSIVFFNPIIRRYPNDYLKIIAFINDCYNMRSPILVTEKSWEVLLLTQFRVHKIPESLKDEIVYLQGEEFVLATDEFLKYQQDISFETLTLKQNFRVYLMSIIRDFAKPLSEKKIANETITGLDIEITSIKESIQQAQQPLGQRKGYDAIVSARSKIKISIASFID